LIERKEAAVDWNAALGRQREALTGILVTLVAMAGEAGTLPRHLPRALLRLLRPAEAAARRLVIALAHTLPAPRPGAARPLPPRRAGSRKPSVLTNRAGTGILMPPTLRPAARRRLQKPSLPLFDPLRLPRTRRRHAWLGVPRISVPGFGNPFPAAPRRPPSPDDPIDAARLHLRLQAVVSTLDDLPAAGLAQKAGPSGPRGAERGALAGAHRAGTPRHVMTERRRFFRKDMRAAGRR
jgi:hypothetical protein